MIDNAGWPDRRGTFTGFLSKVYPVTADREGTVRSQDFGAQVACWRRSIDEN
jgi:hypothetical protein